MSLLDKFKEQFVDHDDEELDEEYEEEATPAAPAAAAPRMQPAGRAAIPARQVKPYTMVVVNPKGYQEAEKIGDHLKASRPVVMNMEKTDVDEAQRIVDFVQGVMYALDGRIDQVSENIYLCAPSNMSVSRETFASYHDTAASAAPQWDPQGSIQS